MFLSKSVLYDFQYSFINEEVFSLKIIAFYLPQYHAIPENDEWWGEGFTEWENLKKAKPLFAGHYQPRVPLNNHYYNLLDADEIRWQANLAKEFGVYGFCIYHYWFSGHMLLEKPTEIILKNKDIDIPFCICWANESWTKAWVSKSDQFLIKQKNGDKTDWINHFEYSLPFFRDERYIKIDGKPLYVVYRPELFPNIDEMIKVWNELAKQNGLDGIVFAYQTVQNNLSTEGSFNYRIEYQPNYAIYDLNHKKHRFLKTMKHSLTKMLRPIGINLEYIHPEGLIHRDYSQIWEAILKRKPSDTKSIPGAFVDWDNTPRKARRGSLMDGFSVEKFSSFLQKQICNAKQNYHSDYLFLFAWNEWTEGGYLEPDERDEYGRLEAVRNALNAAEE